MNQERHPALAGYFKSCNCCGREFSGVPGARAYTDHVFQRAVWFTIFTPLDGEHPAESFTVVERTDV